MLCEVHSVLMMVPHNRLDCHFEHTTIFWKFNLFSSSSGKVGEGHSSGKLSHFQLKVKTDPVFGMLWGNKPNKMYIVQNIWSHLFQMLFHLTTSRWHLGQTVFSRTFSFSMPVCGNTFLLCPTAIILYAQIRKMLFQAKESSVHIDGMHLMLDLLTQPNNNNKCSACSVSFECIQAHFLMWCQQKVSVPMYQNRFSLDK